MWLYILCVFFVLLCLFYWFHHRNNDKDIKKFKDMIMASLTKPNDVSPKQDATDSLKEHIRAMRAKMAEQSNMPPLSVPISIPESIQASGGSPSDNTLAALLPRHPEADAPVSKMSEHLPVDSSKEKLAVNDSSDDFTPDVNDVVVTSSGGSPTEPHRQLGQHDEVRDKSKEEGPIHKVPQQLPPERPHSTPEQQDSTETINKKARSSR